MAATPILEPRRLTRAEYDRMVQLGFFDGERLELLRGTLVRMSPIGPPHASVVSRLTRLLVPRLLDRADVRIQLPLVAHDESEPEPDVAIVPLADYGDHHPDRALLVIEVAESSLAADREVKAPLYAASGVPEYWIVDIAGRAVEVREDPGPDGYARVRRAIPGDSVSPAAFPDVVIAVAELLG